MVASPLYGTSRALPLILHVSVACWLALTDPPVYAPPNAVPGGGRWLQRAIDRAKPGDVITLVPGAIYVGHFVLPAHRGNPERPIVIRSAGADAHPSGARVDDSDVPRMAALRSPDRRAALRALAGARGWRVERVQFLANREGGGEVIALGARHQRLADVPSDITLDGIYLRVNPDEEQRRGIALNSARTTIRNAHLAGLKSRRVDSQAIAGWNGPGPYVIENNYLEAAGENIMFGGADPSIAGLVPTGITIRDNHLSKPAAWRDQADTWLIKNLLELKNARDVVIEDNLIERNWAGGQSGYAVLFTPRNQDGGCSWCQVHRVRVQDNIIRDVAAAISIAGHDDRYPSAQTSDISIVGNLVVGLDRERWGGDGFFLQLVDQPRDIDVSRNTIVQVHSGGIVKVEGTVEGFRFTDNVAGHGEYGIIATDHAPGVDSITASFPDGVVSGNVIAGALPRLYPPGNLFPTVPELMESFRGAAAGDYRLGDRYMTARGAAAIPGTRLVLRPSTSVPVLDGEGRARR